MKTSPPILRCRVHVLDAFEYGIAQLFGILGCAGGSAAIRSSTSKLQMLVLTVASCAQMPEGEVGFEHAVLFNRHAFHLRSVHALIQFSTCLSKFFQALQVCQRKDLASTGVLQEVRSPQEDLKEAAKSQEF